MDVCGRNSMERLKRRSVHKHSQQPDPDPVVLMGENKASTHSELENLSFVHNALPELALSEVSTSFILGKEKLALKFPLLVMFEDREEARRESLGRKDIPVAAKDDGSVEVFLNGSGRKVSLDGYTMERVGDGIEAAKALRLGSSVIPFIDGKSAGNFDLFIKQLRIAMFLTNSKDINALKKAPVYTMG